VRMELTQIPPPANDKKGKNIKKPLRPPDRVEHGSMESGLLLRPLTARYAVLPEDAHAFALSDRDPADQLGLVDKFHAKRIYRQNAHHNLVWQTQLFAERKRAVLVIVQGFHLSGKDEVVRKLTAGLHPNAVRVHSFAEPSAHERQFDFLRRYHSKAPARGEVVFWIRSWYEDVVTATWRGEISQDVADARLQQCVEMERILSAQGTRIVKVFLHVSDLAAFMRLEESLQVPRLSWHASQDDFDQRKRFFEINGMWERAISRSSISDAPWFVIPAATKWIRNAVASQLLRDVFVDLNPEIPPELFARVTALEPGADRETGVFDLSSLSSSYSPQGQDSAKRDLEPAEYYQQQLQKRREERIRREEAQLRRRPPPRDDGQSENGNDAAAVQPRVIMRKTSGRGTSDLIPL